MTGERPDDAHEPDQAAGPADADGGQEARPGAVPDAPFHGLRSAADIFGAPRSADEWPSRRERREAEKAARETGAPLPEPFEPVVTSAPAADDPADAGATQAISMPEELAAPTENPQASAEHERATLGERIPPAAPVPPASTAPHPSSISLPTALTNREQRAAENRAVEAERRRVDPFGEGRSDVDWLGRATGSPTVPTGPVAQQPVGVENVLPAADEPPSFTELLRLADTDDGPRGSDGPGRPFDWAIRDDETGEVPTTLTSDRFDTTTIGGGSWTLADESDDDVVTGEVATPVGGLPVPTATPVPVAAQDAPTQGWTARPDDADEALDATTALPAAEAPDAAPRLQDDGADQRADRTGGADRTGADRTDAADRTDDQATTALPAAGTPWWAEPDATAAPPLVEPTAADAATQAYPAHLPPAVGHDLDAVMGIRRGTPDAGVHDEHDEPEPLAAAAPDDLDQSEWDGRETSDTSAIKDLFGTEAVGQLSGTGYDPHDTGTRMMPAVGSDDDRSTGHAPAHAPGPGRTPYGAAPAAAVGGTGAASGGSAADTGAGGRDNFINEGFARLRNEGRRGKLLLVWGSVALIVVLLVAVFGLTRWILGNTIEEHTPAPTRTSAAASSAAATPSAEPSATQQAAAPAPGLQFATTPAAPGEHAWTDLAGGECLSPFEDAWAQTFTVVDCSTPHVAQLTARLQVEANQWPGPDALQAQAADRCQTSAAINTSAAAAVGDVQVQGAYAPDQETWDRGDVFISCFVTRSSGESLTGSLAP